MRSPMEIPQPDRSVFRGWILALPAVPRPRSTRDRLEGGRPHPSQSSLGTRLERFANGSPNASALQGRLARMWSTAFQAISSGARPWDCRKSQNPTPKNGAVRLRDFHGAPHGHLHKMPGIIPKNSVWIPSSSPRPSEVSLQTHSEFTIWAGMSGSGAKTATSAPVIAACFAELRGSMAMPIA